MIDLYPAHPSPHKPAQPKALPPHASAQLRAPEKYIADAGLVDAVNVALMLRQPLIVTGEPGTGKTVLAWSVAWELGLDEPLVFESKSTSQARDLFYNFDTIGRFAARQMGAEAEPAREYIQYAALGAAIVLANPREQVADVLPRAFTHTGPRRSVVLIDEVEKAPRDFANDILNEIERMYFRIPELGNRRVEAGEDHFPVVIMTNNSEKSLPDAFLRRCIYYHIPFPNRARLEQIVLGRLPAFFGGDESRLAADAIEFMLRTRDAEAGLDKPPGTAELLNWINAMARLGAVPGTPLQEQRELAERALTALIKTAVDQQRVRALLWSNELDGPGRAAA